MLSFLTFEEVETCADSCAGSDEAAFDNARLDEAVEVPGQITL
jgi:hypothetical protein